MSEVTPAQKPQNRIMTIVLAFIAVVVIVVGVVVYTMDQNKKSEDKKKEEERVASESSSKAASDAALSSSMAASLAAKQKADSMISLKPLVFAVAPVGNSGQSGTLTVSPVDANSTKVVINLSGGTFTEPQPAHFHAGSCATLGAVLFPLTNVVAGKSETILPLGLDKLQAQLPVALNVHQSEKEIAKYTACGEVSPLTVALASLPGKTFTASKVSLLTAALVFPTSELTFGEGGSFTLVSSGLDLAILGSPELKVGDVYPTLSGTASGIGMVNKDGKTVDMNVTALKLEFMVNGKALDEKTSAAILAGITKAGLAIPPASATAPIVVNVDAMPTSTGITIKSTKTSPYLITFEGQMK